MPSNLKLVEVSAEEVMKDFPEWFPINEFVFKSFLIRHPELLGKNLEFIGYEIYNADLVFKRDEKLFIIEAKCINIDLGSNKTKIENAVSQLTNYMKRFKLKCNEDQLIPIIAILKKDNVTCSLPNLSRLWKKAHAEEMAKQKKIKRLNHKITLAKKKLDRLNKKVGERLSELKMIKKEMKSLSKDNDNNIANILLKGKKINVEKENEIIMEQLLRGEL